MYEQETRRPSLVSALSTAYTVKSLPGAMLYIPLDSEYNTPVSLKRSLSDPEIYFPSPAVRHSLIVAVNGLFGRDAAISKQQQWGYQRWQYSAVSAPPPALSPPPPPLSPPPPTPPID